ncbi:receptor-type tyrosine-protein phosphatase mu-like [Amphiura filiformis]|uniref:receptor-type tyrosine-protein phosphatase mu-like n=1 Tax=Amphiura filiformis TaxID=82378 RepID=UPI003B20FA8A
MEKQNIQKNRYNNIVPYDHSRVKLQPKDGISNSDYINACYIDDYNQKRKYIATQGPLDSTISDFWRMIWQHKASKIVMLTNCVEMGKKKCDVYWPDLAKGVTQTFDTITVIPVSQEEYLDYTIRTFHMNKIGEEGSVHTVKQFHFTTWPDMGVLQYPSAILNFRRVVREYEADSSALTVVHCSAGVGRTGAYISVDTQLDQAQHSGIVDVYKYVSEMRQQRCKMVQTAEQYQFIYEALLEAILTKDTTIPAANFEEVYAKLKIHPAKGVSMPSLEEQFQLLEKLTVAPNVGSCKAATKTENLDKNRYKDRLPSDRVRPFLVTPSASSSTDYINAALVPGYRKKHTYISTQMPLPTTVSDLWRLVYDYKATSIVMLNVMNNNNETYGQYWSESGSHIYGGNLAVDFVASTMHADSIMIRKYKLYTINDGAPSTSRIVQHFQFLNWFDDQGVPADSNEDLLALVTMVDEWQKKTGSGPIIVHCVDGIGCSGVYCALSTILQRLEESQTVDVFQTVKSLRMVRPHMVETPIQYNFLYEAVQHHISAAGPSAL